MASSQAQQTTSPAKEPGSPKPGWWSRKIGYEAEWWLLLFTGAAATALASFLYVASALAFTQWRLDYGFAFAAFGVLINSFPPAIVWAAIKWTR